MKTGFISEIDIRKYHFLSDEIIEHISSDFQLTNSYLNIFLGMILPRKFKLAEFFIYFYTSK